MGNDGGSIPDRRDLVRSKPKAEQADKANQTKARWFFCALSKVRFQSYLQCERGLKPTLAHVPPPKLVERQLEDVDGVEPVSVGDTSE